MYIDSSSRDIINISCQQCLPFPPLTYTICVVGDDCMLAFFHPEFAHLQAPSRKKFPFVIQPSGRMLVADK